MSKGKPCKPDMSLRERHQMNLDTESATHTGMEGQSRSSHKYLLLQVWCGLLTVAMVVMATFLTSIKPKSSEDVGSTTLRPVSPVSPTINTLPAHLKSVGSSLSYIQLIKSLNNRWEVLPGCDSCSLSLHEDSILCKEDSLYFIYAQVTFTKHPNESKPKSVILRRNTTYGKSKKKLVEGIFSNTTEGSVWVAKIVSLQDGDSVSLDITDDFLIDSTFWGAYQLH